MKKTVSLLVVFLSLFALFDYRPILSVKSVSPVRVACVGDSITEGDGIDNFVTKIKEKIGSSYNVMNFGKSGTTFSEIGDYPYKSTNQYRDSLTSNPDIVIVMLGTNDGKSFNWTASHKATIKGYIIDLLSEYINLNSHPKVFISLSPTAQKEMYNIVPENVQEIVEIQKEVADELAIEIIDINTITNDKPDYFVDGIHPNSLGQELIANEYISKIKGCCGIPGAPINLSSKDSNGRSIVTWADGAKNGSPIQNYNVYLNDQFYKNVSSPTIMISKLENGKIYKVSISSVSDMGESEKSSIDVHPTAVTPEVTGVEDGKVYDINSGEYPVVSWTTKTAIAFLNDIPIENNTEIKAVGKYKLKIINDNVVITFDFDVIDSSQSTYIIGDYDGDQEVTVADALAVLRIAAKLAEPISDKINLIDMDMDGLITVADALAVLRIAAKLV